MDRVSKIFFNEPLKFRENVDKMVRVTMRNKVKYEGTVYTQDPVSETLVIYSVKNDMIDLNFISNVNVKNIEVIGMSDLILPDNQFGGRSSVEPSYLVERRKCLVEWLTRNKIPVEEDNDVLRFGSILTIAPPYEVEDCFCQSEIVLGKVMNLISEMPSNNRLIA